MLVYKLYTLYNLTFAILPDVSLICMIKTPDKSKDLKKLIDIPHDIIKDLKKLAVDADKSLKSYIQDILVEIVEKHRNK